jgi:hypothetical protein
MTKQDIQQRLQDINLEINSLDDLRAGYDDVNIHTIEERISELEEEKINLKELLKNSFDEMIGL